MRDEDGGVWISNAGYATATTACRLNALCTLLDIAVMVYIRKGDMYMSQFGVDNIPMGSGWHLIYKKQMQTNGGE